MYWIFGVAAGVTGSLYFLLNLIWPGWYLDYLYYRAGQQMAQLIEVAMSEGKFLIDLFEDHVNSKPQKTFIIYEDKHYTYDYVDKKGNQLVRACVEIGARPGSTVAIMIHNSPQFVWTYLGIMKGGYTSACININLRDHSLTHAIRSSGANILIIGEGDDLSQAVLEVASDLSDFTIYQQGAIIDSKPAQFLSFDVVMDRMSPAAIDNSMRKHVTYDSVNTLIYTSGTTGLPKAAEVSHATTVIPSMSFASAGVRSPDNIIYIFMPLYHSGALLMGFGNIVSQGATMVLRKRFSASRFWEDCRKYKVTGFQYVGEIPRYLLAQPKYSLDDQHCVKFMVGNGLRADIWEEFQARFKVQHIFEGYGATEMPFGMVNLTGKIGACGRSSPYMRRSTPLAFVKFDVEAQGPYRNQYGKCVPVGTDEVGLMILKIIEGKIKFQGYRGRKEETEKKYLYDVFVDGDKYINTGDLMRIDSEYFVYFNDRVGDTFRWKGENVSTLEVSNVVADIDFIHDANVYGVSVPGTEGRAGMVALSLNDSSLSALSPQMLTAIANYLNKELPHYARPRFIRLQREFQMTATFKQQKAHLVKEGFDVTKIQDPLYYLDVRSNSYKPLDNTVYNDIIERRLQL